MSSTLPRLFQENQITQRTTDGYIDATKMCQVSGKQLGHYRTTDTTKAYLEELSRSIGIAIDLLIHTVKSGPNELRGTWIHPQAAIHLAMWCSPAFAVTVTAWVVEWMTAQATPQLPTETAWRSENKDAFLEVYCFSDKALEQITDMAACLDAFRATHLESHQAAASSYSQRSASTLFSLICKQAFKAKTQLTFAHKILGSYRANYL